jgi:WD40 repeat protein
MTHLAFSPDGQTLLFANCCRWFNCRLGTCSPSDLILWDVTTGLDIHDYSSRFQHFGTYGVALSPDGDTALSVKDNGSVDLWPISLEALIAWIYTNRYVRDLTCAERQLYGLDATTCTS